LQSLLYEINPNPAYAETPFLVEVVEPRKTFLEKAMLLHEQFGKPNIENIKTERMSRHLYDLGNLMNTSFGRDALSDHELYDHLVHHRQWYSRISWVDYQTLGHSAISFLPPPAVLEMYREDYQAMKDKMIYEEVISFDDLINQLKILQGRFRIKKHPISLEEIIQAAEIQILQTGGAPEAQPIRIPITYLPKPNQPAGADNNPTTYLVTLFPSKGKLVFESIRIQ
jgi:hypothetical protein